MSRRVILAVLAVLAAAVVAGLLIRSADECEPGETGTFIGGSFLVGGCPVRP